MTLAGEKKASVGSQNPSREETGFQQSQANMPQQQKQSNKGLEEEEEEERSIPE